jgi:Bifunctional DNA primase/polymerase, N-terminal
MTSSTNIISPFPLKGDSQQQQQQLPYDDCFDTLKKQSSQADVNAWTDYWHYEIGVNVMPVDSKNKRPLISSWKGWQNNPIVDEQHEQCKKDGSYKNGIAVIAGKIWRGLHKDKYLVVLDLDNKKGIDEFINHCFPDIKTLDELSQKTMVEQHPDNRDKAHVYFIVEKPLTNRGSINGTSKGEEDDIPIIEIKSEGKSYVVCSPSIHKNGFRYEIVGTKNPVILDKNRSEQLQNDLNQIYKKYGEIGDKSASGLTPISELFQDDYIATVGSRHPNILRAMDSLIQKHKHNLPMEQIKEMGIAWNQKHCQPQLDDDEVEKQWKCALNFIENNTDPYHSGGLSEKRYITKKINDCPPIFYYADRMDKKIGRFKIEPKEDGATGEKKEVTTFSNIIIDAIPKKIYVYKDNPLLKKSLERTKINFESSICEDFEVGPYDNDEAIIKELDNRHLVLNKKTADEALSCIINAFKENKLVETLDGVTTGGYYLLKGKLKVVEITQSITSEFDEEKVKQCIQFLEYLAAKGWKNKHIFPTVLKWGIIAPFIFSIKFNSDDWIPWLQLHGCGQTGKTTLGYLVLSIWNLDKKNKSLGFTYIDSVARFGHVVSKDTYPILVNEVGNLSTNTYGKYTSITELIKHSVENTTCRGKYFEGKNYQEILALSPMILTSNYTPPSDGSYNRRFVSIHFSEEEKKDAEEQEVFKKLLNENKNCISILGDFTTSYIRDNPSILLNKKWPDIAREILVHFYKLVNIPIPEWIELFEEQRDAIDESSEKTIFELRSFFMNKILWK